MHCSYLVTVGDDVAVAACDGVVAVAADVVVAVGEAVLVVACGGGVAVVVHS